MAKITNQNKEKIISDFEMMKEFELSVRDLYVRIVNSPDVKDRKVKDVFVKIAADELRHADLVQKIINIAANAL